MPGQVISFLRCVLFELYSSRFSTRTARPQGIGQRVRGKKRAYLAQPKTDWGQSWPSLALSWAKTAAHLGPTLVQLALNSGQLAPTWAQLKPNWAPTWRNLGAFGRKAGLACAFWSCVGASGAEVGPKTHLLWTTWPLGPKLRSLELNCVQVPRSVAIWG